MKLIVSMNASSFSVHMYYRVLNEGGIAQSFGSCLGHRRTVLLMVQKKLSFRFILEDTLEAKISDNTAKLITWLLSQTGPSKISTDDLKRLSKMSLPKIYEFFESRMILEAL